MNLVTFLDTFTTPDFLRDKPCIGFRGYSDYPVLFFASIITNLKKNTSYPFESLDLSVHDVAAIMGKCEMSFLGMSSIYWLHDISALDEKSRKQLLAYLKTYRGPNVVLFFAPELPASWDSMAIDLVDKIDKQLFTQIMLADNKSDKQKNAPFINALFSTIDTITLESAYALMRYSSLLGSSQSAFIDQWLDSIVRPEKSLFSLGQYFFAKDSHNFFMLWSSLSDEYAQLFWISFWSEQVWRAHNYIRLMHDKKFGEAKAISFRLPFSFTQRDWKKVSLAELQNVHAALYCIDYQLKNGGDAGLLDLLFSKFFTGYYSKVNE